MAHLVDKDALVAEIEGKMEERDNSRDEAIWNNELWPETEYSYRSKEDEAIIDLINTLEVKEVDLEKFTEKINTFQAKYKHPEIISIKGAMAFMARMFYQYPNVAREWYESLPKATMD